MEPGQRLGDLGFSPGKRSIISKLNSESPDPRAKTPGKLAILNPCFLAK
jgi:hypothetical protein